jgi:phosphate transport system substrate-binding protein
VPRGLATVRGKMTKTKLLLVLGLALTGCAGKKDPDGSGTSKSAEGGKVTLNASGATFQKAAQEVTIRAFGRANPNIQVNYGAGGSGKGRQDFADQVVDFACTDAPYKDADKAKVKGGDFYYIPNVLGAITVSYNLELDKLQLSAETLAKIFQRDIKKWNDAAIAADNPGVTLPDTDIVVAHRSDGSGTTENFTRYLAGAAPNVWTLKSGSTVAWSADTQAGNGNGGVAQIVKSTKGAIGYVDLSDAKGSQLKYAAIKNKAGAYVEPTSSSVTAAGAKLEVKDDLLFSALDADGEQTYPITAQSWCIVYAKQPDKAKGAAVKAYLKFLLTDGQNLLADIDFAPVPKALQDKALAKIDAIQVN